MQTHNIKAASMAILVLGLLLSGCADAGTLQFQDVAFPALVDGEQASIIHIDGTGRAIAEPIDFLRGQKLIALETATLDYVVVGDKDPASGEMELKYYQNKVIKQTFHLQDTSKITWMILLPKKNLLLVGTWNPHGHPPIIRFDLNTGVQKEMNLHSAISGQDYSLIDTRPVWDSESGNLIVYVSDDQGDFWARLNPDDLILTKIAPNKRGVIVVRALLDYDKASNSVVCYGVVGEPPLYTYHGKEGLYAVSLDTGSPRLLMEDTMPANVNLSYGSAIINHRYLVITQDYTLPTRPHYKRYTDLIDIESHSRINLTDIAYLTWPCSQNDLPPPAHP